MLTQIQTNCLSKTTKKSKKEKDDNAIPRRSFLEEDINHLFQEQNLLTDCLLTQDALSLIKAIYFDKKYPQNNIIRVTQPASVHSSASFEVFMVTRTGSAGKWREYPLEKLLDDLVNRVHHILNWHKIKHNKEMGRAADIIGYDYDASLKWLDDLYEHKEVRDTIKQNIKTLLENIKVE